MNTNDVNLTNIVYEKSNDAIVITDSKAKILSVNPAFTNVTGYSPSEAIGKNPSVLKSGIHNKEFYSDLWTSIVKAGYWEGEIWNKRKNGELYNEWLKITTVRDSKGKITNFVAVFKDITEAERMKKDLIRTSQIQKQLLPKDLTNSYVSIRSFFKPDRYVSGDFYDYFWFEKTKILSGYVIDFMGHGLETAIQTSAVRVLVQQMLFQRESFGDKIVWMNNEIDDYTTDDSFAAGIFFSIDFNKMELSYCTAGINDFFKFSNKGREIIQAPGMFLGMFKDVEFDHYTIPIQSGEEYYFFTDGLLDKLPENFPELSEGLDEKLDFFKKVVHENKNVDDVSVVGVKIM